MIAEGAERFGSQDAPALSNMTMDVGIVSENISLWCAGMGLETRPRGSMDKDGLRKLLGLSAAQLPLLNHPVGYPQ